MTMQVAAFIAHNRGGLVSESRSSERETRGTVIVGESGGGGGGSTPSKHSSVNKRRAERCAVSC